MPCKIVQTPTAPAAIGPYSQAIEAGNLLFVSGQLGLDPETAALVGEDLATQARQALTNLKAVLLAGGCDLHQVAAVDVFLVEMDDFTEFNAIYEGFFVDHKPARAVVAVKALPKNARIELKCVACRL
jgi:2-iminobutanoate/2-iminopropanoate deaminase